MITILRAGSLGGRILEIAPESLQVTLEERGGSATWTADTARIGAVTVGDWARISSGPGSREMWRVREIRRAVETGTATVTMEHLINSLKDKVLADEVGPAEMGGSKDSVSCRTAITYALSWQDHWQLWDFGFSGSAGFEFNGDTVYEAIGTVCSTLEGAEWSYDFSVYPFRLNIRPRETQVTAEMRMSRNITTMQTSISLAGMYTRFYPIGKNDLRLPERYLSKNEGLYGTVAKVETDNSLGTEAQLRSWAWERLEKHAEPQVTVTISGLDLSEATGEPLDQLRIGKVCRAPLPEFGSTIVERITRLQWPDALREPERIQVTMANTPEDLASIIRSDKAASSKSGRAGAKKAGEDHAWFVDTETHVAMVAEAVAGEGAAQDWSRVSQVLVDGEGIHQTVTKAVEELVTQQAQIDVNEERILQEVLDRTQGDSELRGAVEVAARKVSMVVKETADGDVIDVAEICAEINESLGSVAWIDAGKVWIGDKNKYADGVFQDYDVVIAGKASIAELDAVRAQISQLTADFIETDQLSAAISALASVSVKKLWLYDSPGESSSSVNVASTALRTASLTRSGDTYYLHLYAIDGTECVSTQGNAMSFSRATTLSGQWGGGEFLVSASPQENQIRSALFDARAADLTWDGNAGSLAVYANLDGGETRYNTGKVLSVDGTPRYRAGYNANDTAFLGDENGNNVHGSTTIAPGGSYTVWPGYVDYDGVTRWPSASARKLQVNARSPQHSDFGHSGNPSSYSSSAGYDTTGKTYLGAISKGSIYAPGYLAVKVTCAGHTEECYITINQ